MLRTSLSQASLYGSLKKRTAVSSSREVLRAKPLTVGDANQSTQVSALGSQAQLVTWDSSSPLTTLSVVIKAGSRYEDIESEGATHFLKHLAFKESKTKSPLRLIRDLEHIGASYQTNITRETISYNLKAVRSNDKVSLAVLADSIHALLNPAVAEYDVNSLKSVVNEETQSVDRDPRATILSALHTEAFGVTGLGRSLYAQNYVIDDMTPEKILNHVNQHYRKGNGMIIVATGVEHKALSDLLTSKFQQGAAASPLKNQAGASNYSGGTTIRIPGSLPTHIGIAFKGVPSSHVDRAALIVLQHIIGGFTHVVGKPLSAGHSAFSSRLTQAIKSNQGIESAEAFNLSYSDAGLFGVIAASNKHGNGNELFNLVKSTLDGASNIKDEEVEVAKQLAKLSINRKREDCVWGLSTEIANAQLSGANWSLNGLAESVDKVQVADLTRVAKELFKSNAILVAAGDVRHISKI